MKIRTLPAVLWLALFGVALIPAVREIAAQTVVCFRKKCVVYPDGSAVCEYTPVDCSKVNIE
ncbi:MAG TPA: hypothetical protein VGC13_01590 [Longimicrobium sp.]|jgi:hypothetical protein|uniref:hypothetical protein n=1 Tax=Longimicrobium sp. TaxID=2029185 RepID=UPI002ED86327